MSDLRGLLISGSKKVIEHHRLRLVGTATGAALDAALEIAELLAGRATRDALCERGGSRGVLRACGRPAVGRHLFHLSFASGEFQAGMEQFFGQASRLIKIGHGLDRVAHDHHG